MGYSSEPISEPTYAWRELLQRWSDDWLDPVLHEDERVEPFPAEVRAARWLGRAGADDGKITRLEARLGRRLPPSYREFLQTTDGWLNTTTEIDRLLPAGEVGWTRDLAPGMATWTTDTTLKISHTPDATATYLLNPEVVTAEGEWEAWYVAHWIDVVIRYRSFWDLMNCEYDSFRLAE
ncbi:SMI1/KNR4 family protein [Streptomyces sp. NPDC005017]|uniref:SMI1/KNR4 family protein n=1 Tax=Streptomyces sp. NPDC005017 TaxID=3364706 RepID=UPI003696BDF1